jgi:hypothetical protein
MQKVPDDPWQQVWFPPQHPEPQHISPRAQQCGFPSGPVQTVCPAAQLEHVPATQLWPCSQQLPAQQTPLAQRFPQLPQLFASLLGLIHSPKHRICPSGHGSGTQVPPWQMRSKSHPELQAPQWDGLVLVSTHSPLHGVRPWGQPTHLPFSHS